MAYRDNTTAKRPTAVVHYRPMNIVASVALMGLMIFMSLFTYWQALLYARSVELKCVRGDVHACTIIRHYGPLTTHEVVPINDIHSVSVTTHTNKNKATYATILFMKDTSKIQLMRAGPRELADSTRIAVDRAVFDPARGESTLDIQGSSPLVALVFAVLATGVGAMALLFTRSARLEFDFDRGTIAYTKIRWPMRPVRRTFRAGEVKSAYVTERAGSKGGTIYDVVLRLADETNLELVGQGGGSKKRNDEVAGKISAHLARMHEEHLAT